MNDRYFVYIIKSQKDGKVYTGYTTDLQRRIREHNEGESGYTAGRGPWELIWYSAFPDKLMAEKFERYLKGGSGYAFARKRLINGRQVLRSSDTSHEV